MNRRQVLIGLGITPVAVSLGSCSDSSAAEGGEEWLFAQTALSATLADGILRMTGVAPSTLCFTNRPEEVTGFIATEDFVSLWGEGENSFEESPPNAIIVVSGDGQPVESVVLLKNPRVEGDDLVYDVDVEEGSAELSGGSASLFIDIGPIGLTGRIHRTRRRTRRRVIR